MPTRIENLIATRIQICRVGYSISLDSSSCAWVASRCSPSPPSPSPTSFSTSNTLQASFLLTLFRTFGTHRHASSCSIIRHPTVSPATGGRNTSWMRYCTIYMPLCTAVPSGICEDWGAERAVSSSTRAGLGAWSMEMSPGGERGRGVTPTQGMTYAHWAEMRAACKGGGESGTRLGGECSEGRPRVGK